MANEGKAFRLRPRRPSRQRPDEARIWSAAFKRLFHLIRMSARRRGRSSGGARLPRPYNQRCAVRVTYISNRALGQWRAHGRYLTRESATHGKPGEKVGFGPRPEPINLAKTLENWQRAGDERMFKIIVSPEFGERMDLEAHTRSLMAQIERDLGTTLQWAAVSHFNTSHPHVHIALRGINDRGHPFRLERDYIRLAIRRHAEDLCTAQLGYRTTLDADEVQRREIDQCRYTSLDRLLNRNNTGGERRTAQGAYFTIDLGLYNSAPHASAKAQEHHASARLLFLQKMGLAVPTGFGSWQVRRDFEGVLRAMHLAADRQRTLAAHGALLSDERLPYQVTPPGVVNDLEGRVLGHGQEDTTGRAYVLIEGADAKVHFIYHEDGIEAARHRGLMRVNSFVRLRKRSAGHFKIIVDDLGDAESILDDKSHFRARAERLIKVGAYTDEVPRWGGWLGRYNAMLRAELKALEGTTQHAERPVGSHGRQ